MSTYVHSREVYQTAQDHAEVIREELKHAKPFDPEEFIDEQVWDAAEHESIYTQDNWDVCNLFRCSPEFHMAEDVPLSEFETVDAYFACIAHSIWTQLIREAFEELR